MSKYFDPSKIPGLMSTVMKAFPTTIELVVFSVFFSLLLGILFVTLALSGNRIPKGIYGVYIAFMRGMPTLILIFILYFVAPIYLKKAGISTDSWSKNVFIIATLSLSSGAAMGEMIRSAFLSVDRIQWDAAYSIGMGRLAAFRRVIFPQMFGVAIPTLGNNIVSIFKSTSLAFSIGAVDIFGQAKLISGRLYGLNRAELYIGVALIYWVICLILEQVTKWAEKLYTKGRVGQVVS
ncbi:MAG: amino acid ABC transporter permease [Lachnospiraceae bacterium]|nr:amino acid ABC transporter permease [Lachnospiraceae bacterium]